MRIPTEPVDLPLLNALLAQARRVNPVQNTAQRWLLLEAVHVVGQTRLLPHARVHALMLATAWQQRAAAEWIGQAMRLALVPLGHLSGRLPLGNTGRSNVSAFAPMAVTLTLTDAIDVSRGDMLVRPENLPRVDRNLDAMVVWMADDPLRPGRQYWIKHAASLVTGTVASLRYRIDVNSLQRQDAAALQMNEVGRCLLTLSRPVAFDAYRQNRATGAFILIDRMSNVTVGAGMIVDRVNAPGFLRDNWDDDTFAAMQALRSSQVTSAERAGRFGHAPLTVLLTGLPGSGKTTIAYALERRLFEMGRAVTVLDGREMRTTVSKGLGFTAAERSENLRRAIDVARFMNEAGLICICAFVAPSAAVRERARQAAGSGRFVEIHLSAPLDTCRAREETGSYARADAGELLDFPGVSAPYDVPAAPALSLDTASLTVDECVERIVTVLADKLDPPGLVRT